MILIKTKKNRNLGTEILRMILCFWVLSFHFLEKKKINDFIFYLAKKNYHVPCFAFISFFYTYKIFLRTDIIELKKRLIRLLIPYILWPIIIYIIHIIYIKRYISLFNLIMQILLGTKFMRQLWYLFTLIILTIFLFILASVSKKKFLYILNLLGTSAYYFQYSNKYLILYNYKYSFRDPLLHTLGMFPISAIAINIASSRILDFMKNKKIYILLLSYIYIFFIFKYNIFIELIGYLGISYIFTSFIFFIAFYMLPLDNKSTFFKKTIIIFTSYTNGIYCLQSETSHFVTKIFGYTGNLNYIILMYFISYLISFISLKIIGKTHLKYLFI